MPRSAPKKCTYVGCRKLVSDSSGRCEDHARPAWVKRTEVTKRITGRRLQKMRADLFAREPLCAECRRAGRVTLATQRDHIIPLCEGGLDDETNEQGLCDSVTRQRAWLKHSVVDIPLANRYGGGSKSLEMRERKPSAYPEIYGERKLPPGVSVGISALT
jgi:5-methylcytosine-specific restriction protein A